MDFTQGNVQSEATIFHPAFWIILGLFIIFGVLSALNENLFNPWEIDPDRTSFRNEKKFLIDESPDKDLFEFDKLFNKNDPLNQETLDNTQKNIYVGIDNSINAEEEGEIIQEKNKNIDRLFLKYFGDLKLKKPQVTKPLGNSRSLTQNFSKRRIMLAQIRTPSNRTEPSTVSDISPGNQLQKKRVRFC